MDRFMCVLLVLTMSICIITFDIFLKSNQWLFVTLSILGIFFSVFMLIITTIKLFCEKLKVRRY